MAASKIYFTPETAVVFKNSGGDVTFTPKNMSNGNARVATQWDRGSGAKPGLYRWFAFSKSGSTYTVGRAVQIFFAQANDATNLPGRVSATDADVTSNAANLARNMQPVGSIVADVTTSSSLLVASGTVFIFGRYVSLYWLNDLGVALTNTDADHEFRIEAIPAESQ